MLSTPTATPTTGRAARERRFHDEVFSRDRRRWVRAFYGLTRASKARFHERVAAAAPADLLEIGCGPQSSAIAAARRGCRAHAIDISPVAVERARAAAQDAGVEISAHVMDAHALAFASNRFDVVCGMGILHHLDLARALPEIARVLRPDGQAIFFEPLAHNPAIRVFRRLTPHLRSADEAPLTRAVVESFGAHFERVHPEFFHLATLACLPLLPLGGASRWIDRADALDRRLFARLPAARWWAWTVVLVLEGPRRTV